MAISARWTDSDATKQTKCPRAQQVRRGYLGGSHRVPKGYTKGAQGVHKGSPDYTPDRTPSPCPKPGATGLSKVAGCGLQLRVDSVIPQYTA